MGIPASEIAATQSDAAKLLDTACTVSRNTSTTPTVYGGLGSTPVSVYSGNCLPSKATAGQQQQYASVVGSLVTWIVKLPYGTGLQRGDVITLTASGDTLLVQGDMDPHSFPALDILICTETR